MWCCSIGTPATGNKGLGTSKESGLKRVPAQPYKQDFNFLKKRKPLHLKSSLNCERQHDGKIEFLIRKKSSCPLTQSTPHLRRIIAWLVKDTFCDINNALFRLVSPAICLQPELFNPYIFGGSSRVGLTTRSTGKANTAQDKILMDLVIQIKESKLG